MLKGKGGLYYSTLFDILRASPLRLLSKISWQKSLSCVPRVLDTSNLTTSLRRISGPASLESLEKTPVIPDAEFDAVPRLDPNCRCSESCVLLILLYCALKVMEAEIQKRIPGIDHVISEYSVVRTLPLGILILETCISMCWSVPKGLLRARLI